MRTVLFGVDAGSIGAGAIALADMKVNPHGRNAAASEH